MMASPSDVCWEQDNVMSRIEGFAIRNFRSLRMVQLGRLSQQRQEAPLTPMTVVIGRNGSGKSSIFDAFGFLADCLKYGVEEACDRNGRGGYEKLHSKAQEGPIAFEIYYREAPHERPITYELAIGLDEEGRPYVQSERLRQRRKNQRSGRPFSFLILEEGRGTVWKGDAPGTQLNGNEKVDIEKLWQQEEEKGDTEHVELEDRRRLGIATLGAMRQHPRISAFKKFLEGWYLSYFTPDAARCLPLAGPQRQLNVHGDNLGNVVQFMEREAKGQLDRILNQMADKIPGIRRIDTEKTEDGRLLLRFYAQGFAKPFYAQQMSDGTLKAFAYLLLLALPNPPSLLCIEEPENGLYHKLLDMLVREWRDFASRGNGATQLFITTHQPCLVDNLSPDEVWILEKQQDGFSTARRASSSALVENLVQEGLPLGNLWYSDYLDS